MTKEELFQELLKDPLLIEKSYLSHDDKERITFSDTMNIQIAELMKISIEGFKNDKDTTAIARQLNKNLNNII